MKLVFNLLIKLNFRAKLYGPSGPYFSSIKSKAQKISYYRIALYFREDVKKFLELTNPCIKNKSMNINLNNKRLGVVDGGDKLPHSSAS